MSTPAATATAPAKKKQDYTGWIIGAVAFILIITGLVLWFKPFVFQKKSWLVSNGLAQFTAAQYNLMSDAEITTAYKAIYTYNKVIPATDTATQTAWTALKAKYVPNTATF